MPQLGAPTDRQIGYCLSMLEPSLILSALIWMIQLSHVKWVITTMVAIMLKDLKEVLISSCWWSTTP